MHIEMCDEGFWVDMDSEVYEDGVDEPLNPEVVVPTDVNAEFDRLKARVAELEAERCNAGMWLMPPRDPDYLGVAYRGPGGEVVVCGSPKSDDETHNCDAMGCGYDHVLWRSSMNDELIRAEDRAEAAEARVAELEAENAKLRRFAENAANYRESAHDYDRDAGYPERAFDDEEEWDRLESMARAALAAKEG